MTDYVRIKDPGSGAEYTYDTAKVDALGLHDAVIDKDALGPDGLPAPTKPHLAKGTPLPGSTADRRRSAKKTAAKKTTEANSPGEDAGQTSATPETEI